MNKTKSVVIYFIKNRVEEEVSVRTTFQKQIREVEGQLQEVQEDLETEKDARIKAEKQKRDLSEVMLMLHCLNIPNKDALY